LFLRLLNNGSYLFYFEKGEGWGILNIPKPNIVVGVNNDYYPNFHLLCYLNRSKKSILEWRYLPIFSANSPFSRALRRFI